MEHSAMSVKNVEQIQWQTVLRAGCRSDRFVHHLRASG
jgi:hypothetical protein